MIAGAILLPDRRCAIVAPLMLVGVLVMAAFAHRAAPPTPTGLTLAQMAEFALPDGSLPILCQPGRSGHVAMNHCEFCQIAGSSAPTRSPSVPQRAARWRHQPQLVACRTGPPVRTVEIAQRPLRGPPAAAA